MYALVRFAALLLLLVSGASAQFNGCPRSVCSGAGGSTSLYTGPGDVVRGAFAFWGLRPYDNGYAQTQGPLANICTPSDALCADVPTTLYGAFHIGATALTCNNSSSICTVKTLYDTSRAYGCSGACNLTQATIADRPTLVVPGAANGCPSTSDYCISNSTVAANGLTGSTPTVGFVQPFSVAAVMKATSFSTASDVWNCTSVFVTFDASSNINDFAGSNFTLAISANTWYGTVSTFGPSSTSSIYANSLTPTTGASAGGGTCNGSHPFEVGWDSFNTGTVGVYTEVGIWYYPTTAPVTGVPALTSTQINALISNQRSFWGF